MRRVTKNILLFIFGCVFILLYCEYGIYYVVIAQCSWPKLLNTVDETSALKVFMLADIHLLGPRKGHWLDKMRREWQMHRAFQTIVNVHQPEVIFILGDLFDEAELTRADDEFDVYVRRFNTLFAVPDGIKLYVAVGNHDVGLHNHIRRGSIQRFNNALKAKTVQLLTIKNNHFVVMNSMAMHGDSCNLCTEAREGIEQISEVLEDTKSFEYTNNIYGKLNYSRPILMQHFPLYRKSDAECAESDSPPFRGRKKAFRPKVDTLSKEATDYLVSKLKPRAVFGGHTHHDCLRHHQYDIHNIVFSEYSIPSFSWRNRPNPEYMLMTISPEHYAVNKCGLPRETTIVFTGVILFMLLAFFIAKRRLIGR